VAVEALAGRHPAAPQAQSLSWMEW
jgi:hypothetical protein